jgi:hypothetical protein
MAPSHAEVNCFRHRAAASISSEEIRGVQRAGFGRVFGMASAEPGAITGLTVFRRILAGEPVDQSSSGLSPREWREPMARLGREVR